MAAPGTTVRGERRGTVRADPGVLPEICMHTRKRFNGSRTTRVGLVRGFRRPLIASTILVLPLLLATGFDAAAVADRFAPVGGSGFTAFRVSDAGAEFLTVDAVSARRLGQRGFEIAETTQVHLLDRTPVARSVSSQAAPVGDPVGTVVAVLDSGIDASHPWFGTHLVPGRSFVGAQEDVSDGHGHGTHVAGIVRQADPTARIMPIRVVDSSGRGSDGAVARGITWAVENGAKVINLSLGGPGRSSVLDAAVTFARSRDVVVVAAAGNYGESGSPMVFPAAHDLAVAVAAVDGSLAAAPFSNRGSYVDVAAVGVAVSSSLPGGGSGMMSGTSMASPYVAGLFAQLRSARPDLDAASLAAHVERTSVDLGDPGRDDVYGWGAIDPARALAEAASAVVQTPAASAGPLEVRAVSRLGAVVMRSKSPVASVRVFDGSSLVFESTGPQDAWRIPAVFETTYVVHATDPQGRSYEQATVTAAPKMPTPPKVSAVRTGNSVVLKVRVPAVAGKLYVRAVSSEGVSSDDLFDAEIPRRGKATSVTHRVTLDRSTSWSVQVCLEFAEVHTCSEYVPVR